MPKHFGYESLKFIVQYMEANQRFEIFRKIPSLRTIERVVPLSIKKIVYKQNEFRINDISYSLAIVKHDPNVQIPDDDKEDNVSNGYQCDFDIWGYQDDTFRKILTPGDVTIQWPETAPLRTTPPTTEHRLVVHRIKLEKEKERLEMHLKRAVEGSEEEISLKEQVKSIDNIMVSYNCHRDKIRLPIQYFIRLEITKRTDSGKVKTREFVEYTRKLSEAYKYLNTSFFGNRLNAINVTLFDVLPFPFLIRFPVNLRFNVRKIKFNCNARIAFGGFSEILENTCFDELTVYTIEEADLLVEQVKSAKILKILDFETTPNWLELLQRLENPHVHTQWECYFYTDYMEFIRTFMELVKPVGTIYTFDVLETPMIEDLQKALFFDEITLVGFSDFCVTFQPASEEHRFVPESWTLKLEVV